MSKLKNATVVMALLGLLWAPGGFAEVDEGPAEGNVRKVTLDEVPDAALAAARKEKPDVFFNAAERIWWNDEPAYRISGTHFKLNWDVYVSELGKVIRVDSDYRDVE